MSSSLSATAAMETVDVILRGGDLREHGVIEVLAVMHAQQLTGVLRVRSKHERFAIFTMEGDAIAAETDAESQRLSQRLMRRGLVTEAQLTRAQAKVDETHPLGEILVQSKVLSEAALETALSEQFKDTLFSAFLVHDGRYEVELLDAVFAENMQLLFDTDDLLTEGQKLRDEVSHVVIALADGELGLASGSAASKSLLTTDQKVVLELAQTHQTLTATLAASRLDRIPTLKMIVALLERHILAIAKISDGPAASSSRRSQLRRDPTAGLFSSVDSVLETVDLSHVVHFTVATDIPLSGIVETLGVEDQDDREAELESQQTVFMERAAEELAQIGPSSPKRIEQLVNVEDADDHSGELVFTEDGEVNDGDGSEDTASHDVQLARQALAQAPAPGKGRGIGLTPAQKQTLRRRVQVYNRMYQTLFAHACQYARRGEVLSRFQAYFAAGATEHADLFQGVEFRTDGTLNPEVVLENLERSRHDKPFEVFDLALHDTTRYLLKDAGALISDAEAQGRLREAVLEIRKQLFRKGADVPSLG